MGDLPNNRDVAVSNLKRALALYEQVEKEAPKDSFQARAALLGKARCLEARNELRQSDRAVRAGGQELARLARGRTSQATRRRRSRSRKPSRSTKNFTRIPHPK